MSVESEETVSLIKSIDSLIQSLNFKNLENEDARNALACLKKSRGFKRIVGDLSSVHVLKFGAPESFDGSQRFRLADKETDYETLYYETDDGHDHPASYTQPIPGLIFFNKCFILQICKKGKWEDAAAEDLP